MDMGPLDEFYVVSQRGEEGKPKKTDLKSYLKPITWTSLTNSGKAFEAKIPSKVVRSMGDHVFVAVPSPYLEKEEGNLHPADHQDGAQRWRSARQLEQSRGFAHRNRAPGQALHQLGPAACSAGWCFRAASRWLALIWRWST